MNKTQRAAIEKAQNDASNARDLVEALLAELMEDDMTEEEKLSIFNKEKDKLPALSAVLESLRDCYNEVAEEEQEKFDNLSEGLQQSERGQSYEQNADTFSTAADEVNDLVDRLDQIEEYKKGIEDDIEEVLSYIDDLLGVEGE